LNYFSNEILTGKYSLDTGGAGKMDKLFKKFTNLKSLFLKYYLKSTYSTS